MSDDHLNADVERYRQAAVVDSGPPPIGSDPLVGAASPIEQLLRALGLAANSGDPLDTADGLNEYTLRDAAATDVADGFAAQDAYGADEMPAAGDQFTSTVSQIPQIAAGIAGAIAGALQPLTQIPQQLAQAAQQAVATGAGLVAQYGGDVSAAVDDPAAAEFPAVEGVDSPADDTGEGWDANSVGADRGVGGEPTAAMALLEPAPIPSVGTAPASAAPVSAPAQTGAGAPAGGSAGMAGMPMMPPGPLSAAPDRTAQPDTKRVTVPAVRNGAPVQGRITMPVTAAATTARIEGQPAARRLVHGGVESSGSTA